MNKPDMDVLDFARVVSTLTTDTPISIAYDRLYGQKECKWWTCQREHLMVWCLYQPAENQPGFLKVNSNYSARVMYESFHRPETLLWLAEALGENPVKLRTVISHIKYEPNPRTACKILRDEVRGIPFDRILELIENKK